MFVFRGQVNGCDYQTLKPKLLSLHMNRHRTEKPFMCEECGARLKSEGILIRHMKLHKNSNKKPFNCGDCGTSLGSKMSLKVDQFAIAFLRSVIELDQWFSTFVL